MQKKKHINDLETIHHMILRTIIGAQAKAPVETLYQETSSISIGYEKDRPVSPRVLSLVARTSHRY